MFKGLREDIRAIRERDPAARSGIEVFFLYSGLHALIYYRASHFFFQIKLRFIARMISQFARFMTGIEIHPGAKIGRGVFLDHGSGIVIGETAEVGDYCTIYQGVTLGGTGKDKGKRHPTLGENVLVGAGAKILGPFTVGDNAKIAANAVVLKEVPPNCTAVGVPAQIVKRGDKKVVKPQADLDQIHIPDPIALDIAYLVEKVNELEEKIKMLEQNGERKHETI